MSLAVLPAVARPGVRRLLLGYLELTKPRIVLLVILTGVPALLIAARDFPPASRFGGTLLGIAFAAAAASSFNHYLDRDIDGLMRSFVHVGDGVMDFSGIAAALKAVGFSGFLSIEQDKHPGDMKETCRRYLEIMRAYCG